MNKAIPRRVLFITAWLSLSPAAIAQETTAPAFKSIVERATSLGQPVVDDQLSVGMVLGILRGRDSKVLAFGETELGSGQVPNADSVYEIGSVSKIFTGILLADAVTRGLLSLEDTLPALLADEIEMPIYNESPIQLWHLSTHTSGLPRMPRNFKPADPENPYADYTLRMMFDALAALKLQRAPGLKYDYSNLAVGLLGNLVARAQAKPVDYPKLLTKRITAPLGLKHTGIELSPWMQKRLVPGYDVDQTPKHAWDLNAFAGAGGIRSNMNDMLAFAKACLHPEDGPLEEALKLSMEVRHTDPSGVVMGLGWHVSSGGQVFWHNGQTGGYHTYFAIWPAGDAAVVLLSNTSSGQLDRFANDVLLMMMGGQPREHEDQKSLPIDLEACAELVGEYSLSPNSVLTISLDGRRLMAQLTAQSALRIYPSAPDHYFYRVVAAELVFRRDEEGSVVAVDLLQGGRTTTAKRKP